MKTRKCLLFFCAVISIFSLNLVFIHNGLAGPIKSKDGITIQEPSLKGENTKTQKQPKSTSKKDQKPSLKKKAVKKAGTAVAIGAAGSKVKSKIKD